MVRFFVSDLQEEIFKRRLERESDFKLFFTKNITEAFIKDFLQADNRVFFVFGSTGSGKSSVTISLLQLKDKNFNASKIAFDNASLFGAVASSSPGDCFMRDETPRDFGEGSYQLLSTIQDLAETLRQRRNSFALLSPVVKGVSFAHFYLEVLQASVPLDTKNIKKFIRSGGKEIFFRVGVYDSEQNKVGFIVVRNQVNSPVWLEYQKQKENFLNVMASGKRFSGVDYQAEAERFLREIDLNLYRRKGERLNYIKQNSNYTTSQCKAIAIELERLLRIQQEMGGRFAQRDNSGGVRKLDRSELDRLKREGKLLSPYDSGVEGSG